MSSSDSLILQLNEVCESNTVSKPELCTSPCVVCISCCALHWSLTNVEEAKMLVQHDIDEVDLPSFISYPDISAAREAREYDRNRCRIKEKAKLAASRQLQQAARLGGKLQLGDLRRKEKGAWGTRHVRNRVNTASLLDDAMEVFADEPLSSSEQGRSQEVMIPPTTDVLVSFVVEDEWSGPPNGCVFGSSAYLSDDDPYSYPLVESKPNIESVMRQQIDVATLQDLDHGVDSSLSTISVAREIRAYEYNRRRVKKKTKLAMKRSRKQDRFKEPRRPRMKPTGRKRAHIGVDLEDELGLPDELEEGSSVPLEVSLTSIMSEEPSGRPFHISDLSYTENTRKRTEPGFEMVAQVSDVIILDDDPIPGLQSDEPWEHVWNDDLLDGRLLYF